MDAKLVAWARAVKARRRRAGLPDAPTLWLFTDERRLPDPLPAIARLPRGLCGVVFRHDGAPGRAALARAVAAICRERRLALSVAGDGRLAASVRAASHLRDGRGRNGMRGTAPTSSAHDVVSLRRAARRGAAPIFLSPWRETASHPKRRGLCNVRWSNMARRASAPVCILGGVSGESAVGAPRRSAGAGAIGALL